MYVCMYAAPIHIPCAWARPQQPLSAEGARSTAVSAQEARYDFLEVNGIAFSGQIGPENVVPSGVIKWDAAAEMHIDTC